jgi:hypothetical protein
MSLTHWVVGTCIVLYVGASIWFTRAGIPLPPDTLEYSAVARSLLEGAGYTIDFIEVHAGLLPAIRHLHELHGLLQPLWNIVPLALGRGQIGLVRVPGLVFAGLTLVVTYRYAARALGLPGACIALALLATSHDLALNATLGSDDVAWMFFSTVSIFSFVQANGGDARWMTWTGVAAGLATLQKFSGSILVLAFALVLVRNAAGRTALRRTGWRLFGPSAAAVLLYLLRNYLVHGSIAFRYGGLDWLAKDHASFYFAFYESPPTVTGVLAHLGVARVLSLVGVQFGYLGLVVASNPVLFIGGPLALVMSVQQHRTFVYVGLIYTLILVLFATVVYHVEIRYLFALLPLYAFAIAAVGARWVARLESVFAGPRAQTARTVVVIASLALVVLSTLKTLVEQHSLEKVGPLTACSDAIEFLKQGSPERRRQAILTSNPWYVTWATGRPTVNAPTNGPGAVARVVQHYGVEWLIDGMPSYGTADMQWILSTGALTVKRVHRGSACSVYRITGVMRE